MYDLSNEIKAIFIKDLISLPQGGSTVENLIFFRRKLSVSVHANSAAKCAIVIQHSIDANCSMFRAKLCSLSFSEPHRHNGYASAPMRPRPLRWHFWSPVQGLNPVGPCNNPTLSTWNGFFEECSYLLLASRNDANSFQALRLESVQRIFVPCKQSFISKSYRRTS